MLKLNVKNFFYLLLYALPNTVLSFGIVYIINNALAGNKAFLKDYMGFVFLSIVIYTYLLNVIFQKRLNQFAFKRLYENEKRVFSQILNAPLKKLEKLGPQRFFTTIEDLRTFSFLPYTVTHTVNSVLMLVLCLVYMFSLSALSALIVIGLIGLVAGIYFVVVRTMTHQVSRLRKFNEHYYKHVDDVMKGFKELKLGFFRRENLMNRFLVPNRDQAMKLDFKINYVFLSINLISQYGLYFVVAIILFILPGYGFLSREDVIAYVVMILFISGPINNIINLQQMYTRFIVANTRIKRFMKDFGAEANGPQPEVQVATHFETLRFSDICFSYAEEGEEAGSAFALGPVSLEIGKGETIFIVGGNGSGKSTFINILTGLYKPTKGTMVLNGVEQTGVPEKMQSQMTAIFTDNHIFSHNYENYTLENNEHYARLLKVMQMDEVIENDKDETVRRKFSKGQSKRVSLIFALLENKPVLVLDEWAADQDPHFRKYFYEQLLPALKKEGKTIIAVTHDDAYFHLADRVLKFDYGTIVKDVRTTRGEQVLNNFWA